MGSRRVAALVAALGIGVTATTAALVWRAQDANDATRCTSLVHPDRTIDFASDLPRRARQSMFTFEDLAPATHQQRDALVAHRYAGTDSVDADGLSDDGVCTATYTGEGHRPSPTAHRSGARVAAVEHVAVILLVHRDHSWTQSCYGPGDACNRGPLKDVTCVRFYDASTLVSLGKNWCFDDAAGS